MKTKMYLVAIVWVCLCGRASVRAQEPTVHPLLEAAVARLDTVSSAGGLKEVRKEFERLYAAEAAGWLPVYYLAYADISLLFFPARDAEKEQYRNEAEACLEQLEKMKLPGDAVRSEVAALKGYGYYAQVALDPAANGPKFAGIILSCFAEALRLNPANPRAILLNAQFRKHMAVFLHQQYDAYAAEVQRADSLFDAESRSALAPHWGKGMK